MDRHDLYTVTIAGTSGNTAYAFAVVVYGCNGTGYVSAMSRITLGRPVYGRSLLCKIVSVDIALVSVAVVVFVRFIDFVLVYPHIGLQVGMCPHYTFVHYGNDD